MPIRVAELDSFIPALQHRQGRGAGMRVEEANVWSIGISHQVSHFPNIHMSRAV